MLSYMIPVDTADKPPPAPQKPPASGATQQTHLNLNLAHSQHPNQIQILTNGNGTTTTAAPTTTTGVHRSCLVTNMSKDSSVNSFASDVTTGTGSSASGAATPISGTAVLGPMGYKNKLVVVTSNGGGGGHQQIVQVAGGKHHSLKRVSFGSSKGSMVETLIYESPLQEEPEPSPIPENGTPFPEDGDQTEDERERVRVSFVQHSKPQEVQLPDEPVILTDSEFMMAAAAIAESNHVITTYTRQESTESGWDNPFRPGGDLSREADEIVELIKGGKPITPTSTTAPTTDGIIPNSSNKSLVAVVQESPAKKSNVANVHQSPAKNGSSGATTTTKNGVESKGGGGTSAVNVQRGTTGQPSADVEHVVLKKEKSKCKCCVVQ